MITIRNIYISVNDYGYLLSVFFIMLILSGCQSDNKPSSQLKKQSAEILAPANDDFFQEIDEEIGLDFVHSIGAEHLTNIVESSGGGAAFLDYDKDSYIDLYVCSGTWLEGFTGTEKPGKLPENHLYRNLQNGTFEDVTKKAGVGGHGYSMGVTVGDFNNDGFPDLYVSNYGPNVLYKNNGNGTFSDVTKKAKVAGNECSIGAVWFDYDNDGLLDLYVGNYLNFDPQYKYYYAPDGFPGPMAYDSQPDFLYHNMGDGIFEDVTKAMGITDLDGRAMGVGAADYDDDGFVDVYVANDRCYPLYQPRQLILDQEDLY